MNSITRFNHNVKRIILYLSIGLLLISISCLSFSVTNPSLEQTRVALEAQMTILAQQAGQSNQLTAQAQQVAQVAQDVQATMAAQQAAQIALQQTQLAQSQSAVETQEPAISQAPAVVSEAPPEQNVDDQIKNAKILLYEDLSGVKVEPYDIYPELYVKAALDSRGYSYKNDGSAMGWFKEDLLTTNTWDLIISSSEDREVIQGEYFEYLMSHINRGAAVIIEMWYLDSVVNGKIAPILSRCGVQYQADWVDPENMALWPLVPDHPIFKQPNSGMSMRKTSKFWFGDSGDLLKIGSGGDATMLLGTIATSKNDHGTLVSCLEGRLLIQTFSTHDYARSEIVPLWENYIYYTLKNRFTTTP